MLTFPAYRVQVNAGFAARVLLRQVPDQDARKCVARALIRTTLELHIMGRQPSAVGRLRVKPVGDRGWRIRQLEYLYVPAVDDDSFERCAELGTALVSKFIIAPVGHATVLRKALEAEMPKSGITVSAIDDFIAQHVLFTKIDLHWPHGRMMQEFLARYNRWAAHEIGDDSLSAQFPADS